MITRKVQVGDKEITFRMSAATPRIYRAQFQQDLLLAMEEPKDLEIFENLAWVCAGCPDKTIDKWLEKLPPSFSVEIMEVMLEMWAGDIATVDGAEKANGKGKNVEVEEG